MVKQHPNVVALRDYQRWRRGAEMDQPAPAKVGELIDWAIKVCEAASKTLDQNRHLADGDKCTLKALRVAIDGK